MTQDLPKVFITTLASILPPDGYTLDPAECGAYGFDNSPHLAQPQAVAFPRTHQQIEQLIQLCNVHSVAITPRGRGTGTTGATVPIHGGLVLSLENMNAIVRMDPENRMMIVQPGVTNEQVQLRAAEHGFFCRPIQPAQLTAVLVAIWPIIQRAPEQLSMGLRVRTHSD